MIDFRLRKCYNQSDISIVYNMMSNNDQYLFSTKLVFNSDIQFEKWFLNRLENNFHDFYLVELLVNRSVIGYVHNYDFSLLDGTCKLSIYLLKEYRFCGIGGLCTIEFMNKLFMDYPLRKIYVTIYDYNIESLTSNKKAGFVEEGTLEKYRYYNGTYHSLHILSMDRDTFYSSLAKFCKSSRYKNS